MPRTKIHPAAVPRQGAKATRKPAGRQPPSAQLTASEKRELRRRIKYYDDPMRYVVWTDLVPGSRLWLFLDVSDDTYCVGDLTRATLFKREGIARMVAKAYSKRRKRGLLVGKVSTRNGTRKLLAPTRPRRRPGPAMRTRAKRRGAR